MKKKELLERIEKLEEEVRLLREELQSKTIYIPWVSPYCPERAPWRVPEITWEDGDMGNLAPDYKRILC